MTYLDEQALDAALRGTRPVAAVFSAAWCGPCGRLTPVLEALASRWEDRAVVAKVDVDEQQSLAARYGIVSVPTVLFFKNGTEAARKVGAHSLEAYEEIMKSIL